MVPLAARFTVHGSLWKPSVHACKLLGPPKFKHARAPQCSRVMETPGKMRPCGQPLKQGLCGPTPQDGVPAQAEAGTHPQNPVPPGAEAGRNRRRRRLRAPEALAEPGGLRGRAEHGAGMGRGGWGPEQGRPEGAAGEGRAGGGGYKPHTLKRRALSSGRTHSPPPYTPPLMAALRATPTLKATGRSDCDGRDCGSGEALAPYPLNFHRHPPQATKRRPHNPELSHTCCLLLSANHERPGYPLANQDGGCAASLPRHSQFSQSKAAMEAGKGESDGRREGVGLRNRP